MTETKTATLTVDGKDYPLAWNFNAVAMAEQLLPGRVNLLKACETLSDLGAMEFLGLLYAAIRSGDPASKITLLQVGDLLRLDTLPQAVDALGAAYTYSIPANAEPEPVPEEKAPAPEEQAA
jgi:hypothetical protein